MNVKSNRRRFLGTTVAAATGGWAGGQLLAADAPAAPGPNDTINLGLIGCGTRGRQLMRNFADLPGVRFTAVCDVNSLRKTRGRMQAGDRNVDAYHDYRELLESKAVDAVIVATQAHWHVLIAVHACQAGKDVYLEKPLGNAIREGRYPAAAAERYNRVVQFGTQQRSREHYQKAVELIQSGRLGDISEVEVWDCDNWWPSFGSPPDCEPPPELDWNFYVGPSPYRHYNPNIYHRHGFNWFKVSGGGHPLEWGTHHFDVVLWAMGVKWPTRVSAMGGKIALDDNREWPDTLCGTLEFGPGPVARRGFVLQYTMRIGARRVQRSHGKCFLGTQASMLLDRSRFSIAPEAVDGRKVSPAGRLINEEEETLGADDEWKHYASFLENVRNRKRPPADAATGYYASNLGHLLNISWQVGRSINWDGEHERVLDDPEAEALVHKPYRLPWRLEL